MKNIGVDAIKDIILEASKQLYRKDYYLIEHMESMCNNEQHVSERAIVFRFGIYLNDIISSSDVFKKYNLDSEYNRNMSTCKSTPNFPNGTYPDLIIHKRGSNEQNILIIECKTWWNSDNSNDLNKIRDFLDANGEYKYNYGASITFDTDGVGYQIFCEHNCIYEGRFTMQEVL